MNDDISSPVVPAPEAVELQRLRFEREKWEAEVSFKKEELAQKLIEIKRNSWTNPLIVTVLGATVAALASIAATLYNAYQQNKLEVIRFEQTKIIEEKKSQLNFSLESSKAEDSRILEVIKTGDPDKAAKNIEALLDMYLIENPKRREKLRAYLNSRNKGEGLALPGIFLRPAIPWRRFSIQCKAVPQSAMKIIQNNIEQSSGSTDLQRFDLGLNLPQNVVVSMVTIESLDSMKIDILVRQGRNDEMQDSIKIADIFAKKLGTCTSIPDSR